MNKKDFDIRTNVIKETFNDNRKIISSVNVDELDIDESIHQGGDIFITVNGEFIDLEFQPVDFSERELNKYVRLAEELYEKSGREVTIYVICPKSINVLVNEHEICSDAEFTIKLACIQEDPCEIILNQIKEKIRAEEMLDFDDLKALAMLQKNCRKEDRHYYEREYAKIINMLYY